MDETIKYNTGVVTGSCTSRLNELKKYKITENFSEKYFGYGSTTSNGVDYINSTSNNIIYYLDGIKYTDIIVDNTTTSSFEFITKGYNSTDFGSEEYIKIPEKENLTDNPKIENDLFIDRQQVSVFENNYKLEHVKNMVQLNTYVSGKYFKIVSNN